MNFLIYIQNIEMNWAEKHCSIDSFNSIENYKSYLKSHYPERILQFYRSKVVVYAERNMGRNHYQKVVSVLKKMKTYKGGTELVETLLADFRQK